MEQKGLCKEERKINGQNEHLLLPVLLSVTHKHHPHKDDKFYISVIIDAHDFLQANTGLFRMIVGVLTTCHTQYT